MKRVNLGQKDIIHFIGIGGIGMSGLAQIMNNMGFKIQGSDQSKNKNTIICSKSGIKIFLVMFLIILKMQLLLLNQLQLKIIILNCNQKKFQFIQELKF